MQMGNLGMYQEVVTAAKRVGGVENLIKIIEDSAVAEATPRLLAKGAGVGAIGALATVAGVRRCSEWKAERAARAHLAKAQLRAEVENALNLDAGQAEAPQEDETCDEDEERR